MAPLAIRLFAIFLAGACLGSLINWAIYTLAWNPRPVSPWGRGPNGGPPRQWWDRVPVLGWLTLRREASFQRPCFWLRPMLLELIVGAALVALYWWEVMQLGLMREQLGQADVTLPLGPLHWQFFSHSMLFAWMMAASFIDIDEKIIPDEITVTGTLLGLMLAAVAPLSLLPHVSERPLGKLPGGAPAVAIESVHGGAVFRPGGSQLYLEPVTANAPQAWPPPWGAPRSGDSLVIGLGCYLLWCFALAPRIWRGRRGPLFALRLITIRLHREFTRPPLNILFIVGLTAIAAVWWFAEERWAGLLTSLIGLAASGGIVWAVRLIGTAALRREAMGFGDVTLMMMIGTFLGWQACLIAFFVAPFAGLIVGISQFVLRRDDVIPYGPFLCLGAALVVVKWAPIWVWAQPLFVMGGLIPAVVLVCLVLLGLLLGAWRYIKERLLGISSSG